MCYMLFAMCHVLYDICYVLWATQVTETKLLLTTGNKSTHNNIRSSSSLGPTTPYRYKDDFSGTTKRPKINLLTIMCLLIIISALLSAGIFSIVFSIPGIFPTESWAMKIFKNDGNEQPE